MFHLLLEAIVAFSFLTCMVTLLNDFCFRIIMQFVAYENAESI